jgi:hypothetical protein
MQHWEETRHRSDGAIEENLYIPGHLVPAGRYRRVDGQRGGEVVLVRPDYLPASLDGHVALYQRFTESPAAHHDRAAAVTADADLVAVT